jgi:hypothetical protein
MLETMKKTTEKRIGIGLTKEDIGIFARLQKRFGEIGPTAVVRMAIRALERTR